MFREAEKPPRRRTTAQVPLTWAARNERCVRTAHRKSGGHHKLSAASCSLDNVREQRNVNGHGTPVTRTAHIRTCFVHHIGHDKEVATTPEGRLAVSR